VNAELYNSLIKVVKIKKVTAIWNITTPERKLEVIVDGFTLTPKEESDGIPIDVPDIIDDLVKATTILPLVHATFLNSAFLSPPHDLEASIGNTVLEWTSEQDETMLIKSKLLFNFKAISVSLDEDKVSQIVSMNATLVCHVHPDPKSSFVSRAKSNISLDVSVAEPSAILQDDVLIKLKTKLPKKEDLDADVISKPALDLRKFIDFCEEYLTFDIVVNFVDPCIRLRFLEPDSKVSLTINI
jgi:hypothetical protein